MSGKKGPAREEAIRHLKRRGSLSGGIVYAAPGACRAAGDVEPPPPVAVKAPAAPKAKAAAKADIVVRTSPEVPEREMKKGFTRDTRGASGRGLFDADSGPGIGDLDLAGLERMVAGCTACGLHETRNNTVFGDGSTKADLVFVGEAPGRDEDLQGLPFVGRAGKLLDRMIEAIGFRREDVFIANILKCRPPNNRDPKEDEVTACEKYLARQIELLDPVLICALGRIAGQNLLGTRAPLRVLREGVHHYNGIRVVVTYHPAALLRNPNWKKGAWEDLQMLMALHDEFAAGER
jgi:DNA polymerase